MNVKYKEKLNNPLKGWQIVIPFLQWFFTQCNVLEGQKKDWFWAESLNVTNSASSPCVRFVGPHKIFNWTYGVLLSIHFVIIIVQYFLNKISRKYQHLYFLFVFSKLLVYFRGYFFGFDYILYSSITYAALL